jgi:hypothetical protein
MLQPDESVMVLEEFEDWHAARVRTAEAAKRSKVARSMITAEREILPCVPISVTGRPGVKR